jgi:hypothetical protein
MFSKPMKAQGEMMAILATCENTAASGTKGGSKVGGQPPAA